MVEFASCEAGDFQWVEPSAGGGAFITAAPAGYNVRGLDIEPRHSSVESADFMEWLPDFDGPWCAIGNPPFGNHGLVASAFIERALDLGARYVGFILPGMMRGYYGQRSVRARYGVLGNWELGDKGVFVYPDGSPYIFAPCVFQIWGRGGERAACPPSTHPDFQVVSFRSGKQQLWEQRVIRGKWDLCVALSNRTHRIKERKELPDNCEGVGAIVFFSGPPHIMDRIRELDWKKMEDEIYESGNPVLSAVLWRIVKAYTDRHGHGETQGSLL